MIQQYKIADGYGANGLTYEVMKHIKQGWELQGSPYVGSGTSSVSLPSTSKKSC